LSEHQRHLPNPWPHRNIRKHTRTVSASISDSPRFCSITNRSHSGARSPRPILHSMNENPLPDDIRARLRGPVPVALLAAVAFALLLDATAAQAAAARGDDAAIRPLCAWGA
jgi:hypothetical protein